MGWAMLLDKDNAEDEEGAVSSSASPSRPRHGKLATGQWLLTGFITPMPQPQGTMTIAPVHPPQPKWTRAPRPSPVTSATLRRRSAPGFLRSAAHTCPSCRRGSHAVASRECRHARGAPGDPVPTAAAAAAALIVRAPPTGFNATIRRRRSCTGRSKPRGGAVEVWTWTCDLEH